MNIDEKQSGSVCILTPRGDIWFSGGWSLHDKVKDVVERDLFKVVIDFSHIDRINSMGVGMLVSCLKTLRDKEGDLVIACANQKIQDVLKIVNLYTVLRLVASVDEAVKELEH
jgi:anti-sigma B factor antagonist